MGSFIREQLVREGVAIDGVHTDKDRLSRLVLLAVQAEGVSPTIFYRADCADMALDESDIDEALIARSRAIVVTGTHFSKPNAAAAQSKAIALAKRHSAKVVFDIDYRPNLWGLAGHEAGFARYVKSEAVSTRLSAVLADCDLIVGTEEEVMIAAGADSVLDSLRAIRAKSSCDHRPEARRSGVRRLRRADPREPGRRDRRQGLSGGGVQRSRRRRRLHVRFLARVAARREPLDLRHLGERLRRFRGVAPPVFARIPDLARAAAFPRSRQPGAGAAQGRRIESYPLGDDAPARYASVDGLRDRSPHSVGRTGRGRSGCRAHFRVQGAGGRRRPARRRRTTGVRDAARRQIWPRRAVCGRRRARPVGGQADRTAGFSPASVRVRSRYRQPADRVAGGSLRQGPLLLPSRRRRRAQGGTDDQAHYRLRGRPQGRTRDPHRDHRLQGGAAR